MIGVMGADMKLSSIQEIVENFASNTEDTSLITKIPLSYTWVEEKSIRKNAAILE